MAFCKFSPSFNLNNKVIIDSAFITDFLPKAPDLAVKVYLLGLNKCSADDENNTLEYFVTTLKVCEDDIVSLFRYWEDMGLVQVLSTNPVEVRYLPISSHAGNVKKFQVDKYTDFNIQMQEIFNKRMVMPNEFSEFYFLIEKRHFEQNALLVLAKYCVENKGFSLSPNYVVTVAKDWEREGVRTLEQVQEKITELGVVDDEMNLILSTMGTKRKVQLEDKELLNKWLKAFGFELNVVLFVVKNLKNKKRRLDVNVLDEHLTKYYEMKLMSVQEFEHYENEKENLYFTAMAINKELGIFYEDLTKEIDTYVVAWLNMGFDVETLKLVADNCFKSSVRTLEGYNNVVLKLFKLGIVSTDAYLQYINDSLALDSKIKEILIAMNLTRNVNNIDRTFYSVWTNDWQFEQDVILYAASLSKDKPNAMPYLNKILSNWKDKGIKSLDKAKQTKVEVEENKNFIKNNYTTEQLSSLIQNLDEVEV